MLDDLISRLERRLPEGVRRQYLAKFAVSIAVVAVVTLLASAFLFSAVQADIKGNTQESLQIAAEDDAEDIASWIDEYEQQAHVMSMYQEMQVNDEDAITSTLEVERNQMPEETHSLHYFDAETGEIEYSSGADMTGTTLSDLGLEFHVLERENVNADANIEEVSADSFELSQVDTSFSDVISYEDSNVIGVVSPIRGKDKGVLILIEVSTRAGAFTEQIDGQNTRTVDLSDGTVGIDEAGNATGTTYRNGENSPVIGTLRETGTSGATDRDDTNEVVGYAPIEGTDWAVVTHAPQSSAYAVANTVRNGFIAVIGVVLLGFVAIGATIGRTTARSLDQLADQAQALARGETDLEIGSDGRVDELGRVQDSVAETQAYIDTAAEQSGAIADHRFDDPVLEREVPGQLGDSLEAMSEDLESFIRELEKIASGEFGTTMQQAASGDLTQRIDPDAGNEALREIAVSFNEMMDDIERTVASISDLAADVDSVSNEIASNAGQIEEASADVTDSIDDVSESAAEQKDRFDAVHNEMDAISATIEEIASSSTQVAGVTTDAAERAEATRDDAADVLEEMARIEERTDDVTERIRELGSEMEQIDEIVALIDEIAEQTSILALNANIEAARASGEGDASEGFGVVADEVKDLANETADATQEADSLISELQESTEAVVGDIGKVQNSVEGGVKAVEESIEALDDIVDRVEEAEQGVQSINQATDEQATSTEDVARMVDEVIEISEETDAEADNVASAAREQTASIARISEGTEELTDRSQALRTELETFEWNDGGQHTTGSGSDHGVDASRSVDSGAFERETEPRDTTDAETDGSEGSVASDD